MPCFRPTHPAVVCSLLFLLQSAADAAALGLDSGSNAGLGQAGNGVPVVNIATPDANGLSHNRFSQYNVGREGLILNNADGAVQTQLGGVIGGNPNLAGGAARRILNEVTGGSRSQLRGYTEVAGQGAQVIVANPNGITCNGCGFINTPRATLTTGKPLFDSERLQGYDVDAGDILVEGAGLDARGVEQFELITRSATLNAALHARQLDVVVGRNRVDADSLSTRAKESDGSAQPRLAIDSSALGGMYANSIRLVGTEQGVGVKLAGELAASAGDIRIDSNGRLELARLRAAGDTELNVASDLRNGGSLESDGRLSMRVGGSLDNRGGQIRVRGREGVSEIHVGGLLDNSSGYIESAARDLDLRSGELLNAGGTISHGGTGAFGIDLVQLGLAGGRFVTRSSLTVKRDHWVNHSQLQARDLYLDVGRLEQGKTGKLIATGNLQGRGGDWRNDGQIVSEGSFELRLDGHYSGFGRLMSQERFELSAGSLALNQSAILDGGSTTLIDVRGELSNQGTLTAWGELWLSAGSLVNRGVLGSHERVYLNVGQLDNDGGEIFGLPGRRERVEL
ncbi:filamentous hemagglutinin N-terminal domain-containing protein [Pseudomonas knackmussii]|uniref:filamentous hemagglutinin N-terminal domain-containing protein n=1 Tax=Pseudomonas knackmussii TaxID=65741 RepID=UPI00136313DB|nr:filamentous hemagglutinin N-terminal domain-containing protein [Pseudomonas knackmussii]